MSTTNTSSTGTASNVGGDLGNRAGGVFNAMHGAGEAIRGNINSFLDQGGDALAGREHGSVPSRETGTAGHESTAQKGINELSKGISQIQGERR
ncbi:hypothetical protein BMF94_0932 [Rhodotorula taiwanensis]|uniref:Uncharacterized protein n=1 Tax=Rhodotorula taiwanensis TaxID=741276 RepID=A0A2S5BGF5_9BASI|nr:hypothetical protein BMF94_0932 [Rhodotorula taiwanensis]